VISVIECAGAPRDLGLDQGRACRLALHEARARAGWLERWRPALGSNARLERDVKRHFPHLAESLSGLAAGARLPERWLYQRLADELAAGSSGARAAGTAGAGGALLAISFEGPWIARRSRPEGMFASVELARPWLVSAFAGVNEAGLAVVAAPARGRSPDCAAPAGLLAQDCLQRFAKLENALDWCSGRPAGHAGALLIADAEGELAGIEIRGAERRVLRPESGLLAWAEGSRDELAKSLREAAPATPEALVRALGTAAAASLVVDPAQRWLELRGTGAPERLAL
jgi:hypothetical protein